MPGVPTHSFNAETGTDTFQLREGDQLYVVSVVYLTRELREMPSQKLLDQTKAGFLRLLPNSKLVKSEAVKIQGVSGITCLIESQAPGRPEFRLKTSAVIASERLFSFGFATRKDLFVEADVDKYLATFRLK